MRDLSWETDETVEGDEHTALTAVGRPFLELCEASCYPHPVQPVAMLALDLLQTGSGPGPITDVDIDLDSELEADAAADAAAAAAAATAPPSYDSFWEAAETVEDGEAVPLTTVQRQCLELYDAQCNQDRTQAEVAQAVEHARGIAHLADAARWKTGRGLGSRQTLLPVEAVFKDAKGKSGRNLTLPRTGAPPPEAPGRSGGGAAAGSAEEVLPGVTCEQMDAQFARPKRTGGGERAPPSIHSFHPTTQVLSNHRQSGAVAALRD